MPKWRQLGDYSERFRRGRMLHEARLRFSKKVVRHSMSQKSYQLLHWKSCLVRKLLKGCTRVKWDKELNVVTENRPETDRSSKLVRSERCHTMKR